MRYIAFDTDDAYLAFLRSGGTTVIHFELHDTESVADDPPGYQVLRDSMHDSMMFRMVPYPMDEQGMLHLFSRFATFARASRPENPTLWKKVVHFSDGGLHMAYKGDLGATMFDEHLVEWVDFQVQLKARYHLAFEDVDAIYVRSLKDVELGMRVTDARGTKAVLQADGAASAVLTRRGLRVPVIGLLELLQATFADLFDITVTNPRAAHRWSLVREAWRAAPIVKHWIDAANRPGHAAYHAGMEALGLV